MDTDKRRFPPGTLVRLKSGGPTMVTGEQMDDDLVAQIDQLLIGRTMCSWIDDVGDPKEGYFFDAQLTHAGESN